MSNSLKLSVDFRYIGPVDDVDLILYAIKKHNCDCQYATTPSKYIINCTNNYDSTIDDDVLSLVSFKTKAEYIINRFEIYDEDDFYYWFKHLDKEPDSPLPHPGKSSLSFNVEDLKAMKAYKILSEMRHRDRSTNIYKYVRQYVSFGRDHTYLEYTASRMMWYMKNAYESDDENKKLLVNEIMNSILRFMEKDAKKNQLLKKIEEKDRKAQQKKTKELEALLGRKAAPKKNTKIHM